MIYDSSAKNWTINKLTWSLSLQSGPLRLQTVFSRIIQFVKPRYTFRSITGGEEKLRIRILLEQKCVKIA